MMSLPLLKLSASLAIAALGAHALPTASSSTYAVKERHVVPRAWTEAGPADKSQVMHLQIGLKQRNEGVIERHLLEVSNPHHERYGQHLSAQEVHDLVAPADETVDAVRDWLLEHDISDIGLSPAKDWIHIVVPIGKAEELLRTKYSNFINEDGHSISRAPEWSLPLHLHEHVDVVQPTTSFFRPKAEIKPFGPVGDHFPSHPPSWWEHTGKHQYGQHPSVSTDHPCSATATTSLRRR